MNGTTEWDFWNLARDGREAALDSLLRHAGSTSKLINSRINQRVPSKTPLECRKRGAKSSPGPEARTPAE
jgi:hypothetical protein